MSQDKAKIKQLSATEYRVDKGFVPNMNVPGYFYVNERLKGLIFDELRQSYSRGGVGGFLPAVKQLANVAALPGIVEVRLLDEARLTCYGTYTRGLLDHAVSRKA